MLKTIALCLAIAASAQTVIGYAEVTENLTDLIKKQEKVLSSLLNSKDKPQQASGDEEQRLFSKEKRQKIIIKNLVRYVRLIEGQEDLILELREQDPDLDFEIILAGKDSPGI